MCSPWLGAVCSHGTNRAATGSTAKLNSCDHHHITDGGFREKSKERRRRRELSPQVAPASKVRKHIGSNWPLGWRGECGSLIQPKGPEVVAGCIQ
jgi:hypothetical protein